VGRPTAIVIGALGIAAIVLVGVFVPLRDLDRAHAFVRSLVHRR
jgi:hypothetical protein